MDDSRFDLLARQFASGVSRRGVLKSVLGAAVAVSLDAFRGARASGASCRDVGQVCRENANCCSTICGPKDRLGRALCECPPGQEECNRSCVDPTTAYQSDVKNCGACGHRCPQDQCLDAVCDAGVCGLVANPASAGRQCNDNNLCTVNDVCQEDGSCKGTPKDCSELDDQCNTGVCDEATGNCVKDPLPNGTDCEEGDLCSTGDTCQNGVCQPGAPKVCPDRGPCLIDPVCMSPGGDCEYDDAPLGTNCSEGDENCLNGTCCPTARRCPTAGGDVCCPSGQSCTTLDLGDQTIGICCDVDVDSCVTIEGFSPNLVCCPSGVPCQTFDTGDAFPIPIGVCCAGEACLSIDFAQGVPSLGGVCCDSGESCAPLDFSSLPLGYGLDELSLGICCASEAVACAEFNFFGSGGPSFSATCCASGETCQTVSFDDSGLFVASTCCAIEACPLFSLDDGLPVLDAVCCSPDTVCTTLESSPFPTGQCCPPGDGLVFDSETFATRCCADPCLEIDGGNEPFASICCSDTQQICAPLEGYPTSPEIPGTIGKCCDDGQLACLAPGSLDGVPATTCCDSCQNVSIDTLTLPVCCPPGTVPQLETGSGGSATIVCVAD